MDSQIQKLISPMFGKICCRIQVGQRRSLSLGFGEKIFHEKPRLRDAFYGEWEIGTYYSAWRIMKKTRILYASNDVVENSEEFSSKIELLDFGRITSLKNLTEIDIRAEFDGGLFLDILASTSDEDESFHVFCPGNVCIEFAPSRGWKAGVSNIPWKD